MPMCANWKGCNLLSVHCVVAIPNSPLTITENNLKFNVNFESGHKTGFYLDQRENRLRVRELAQGRDVLDCFCYTGGFTVNALEGGRSPLWRWMHRQMRWRWGVKMFR